MTKCIICILLVLSASVFAADTTITRTYYLIEDATCRAHAITPWHYGAQDSIVFGKMGLDATRGILGFSLQTVTNLTDSLQNYSNGIVYCSLFAAVKKATGIDDPGDTTYFDILLRQVEEDSLNSTRYKVDSNWATVTCGNDGLDYDSDTRVPFHISDTIWNATTSVGEIKVVITEIADSVRTSHYSQFGGIRVVMQTETTNERISIWSQEKAGTAYDPHIKISYTIPLPSEGGTLGIHGKPGIDGKRNIHGFGRSVR